jgi:hypothetical protein
MAIARESRVVRHLGVQAQTTEPAIGRVQTNLIVEPALRADAKAITRDQHPDHQLRIDRWTPHVAGVVRQLPAHAAQIHEPVDPSWQVIGGGVNIEVEIMEKPIRRRLPAHHRTALQGSSP